MLQGFIVLFAIITFTIMACDPRPNETSRNQSAWQAQTKTSEVLIQPEHATKIENLTTKTQKIETEQT
ncbi:MULTISPECIES: hypothetical protein [unclassified Acinetobacter]|uniref:ABZJ_00068 family colistin stress protein n=1 Tax=unclassified Acinetobacter TaxID=196816 RepID=UPI00190D960A|nr:MULTISPECIES: hypothetical protein [unclassified Acinetobacter]MBK0064289.1 hypothetical protein [Acinetobacter sp. S55]MBK0067719.1 hypothetical protein [Acinetobacter sp. S54]